jgi:hypothetical protein
MPDTEFSGSEGSGGAKPASVALVPLTRSPHWSSATGMVVVRPDPSFVTHLIAMAELSPQTRMLRRAPPEDVQAAYRSVANQNHTPAGVRMRQVA